LVYVSVRGDDLVE